MCKQEQKIWYTAMDDTTPYSGEVEIDTSKKSKKPMVSVIVGSATMAMASFGKKLGMVHSLILVGLVMELARVR